MALSRVTTWVSGQVLTASALNGEFDNILNNGVSLVSPLAANWDLNGFRLINVSAGTVGSPGLYFSSDSDTGLYRPSADTTGIAGAGVDVARFTGVTGASTYALLTHSSVSQIDAVRLETAGATNTPLWLVPQGTGYVIVPAGTGSTEVIPGVAVSGDLDTGFAWLTGGTLSVVSNGRIALQASPYQAATNYLIVSPNSTGSGPTITASGSDTNVDLNLATKGAGNIKVATAFIPASISASPPPQHALHRENVPKAWVQFTGAAGTILDSYNVSSVTRNSTGNYTIALSRAFTATQYVVVSTPKNVSGAGDGTKTTCMDQTTSSFVIECYSGGALTDSANWIGAFAIGKQ